MKTAKTSTPTTLFNGAWIVARREIRDQFRDWRILAPILLLTLFFPLLMNFTASQAVEFVGRYGAPIIGERLIPFLLMVVGFFPISISLVIALESFAGERERQTLEPLLATPLSDGQLYLGKMAASLVPPLTAAYMGIAVYLIGLLVKVQWVPSPQLLIQILSLTTIQAIVMVSGAVVISSLTTSVRAANLLASFIIIPVAQLIIGESLIMFWGRYHILWWIVLALLLIAIVLMRMGLRLFNREELLARELDVLDLRGTGKRLWSSFLSDARNPMDWYGGLFSNSLRRIRFPILITSAILSVGFFVGYGQAESYRLPAEIFQDNAFDKDWLEILRGFGMLTPSGVVKILWANIRALILTTILGVFTFGVLAEILLMAPLAIIGYFAGSLTQAGQGALQYLTALVLPHAILEVPAAILAGAAILQLGMAAISLPKGSSLGEGWITSFAEWARIMIGIVLPLLIAAAFLEVFLTPRIAVWLLSGS
ncbi:MAG: stage II sporulation protein M [Anaerolineales bacterium]